MQFNDDLLLGKSRFGTKIAYEGLLLPNLQPITFTMPENNRTCIYTTSFGNNYFLRAWGQEQEKIENIIKTGEATHKIIKNEELEFLLAYHEIPELTIDFLYEVAKDNKRCTFVLSIQNLQKILLTFDKFSKKFKHHTRTYQYKEDNNKLNNNYIFTLSIYAIDIIVANLKNKKIDGLGIAVEIFNKQYTEHYKIPCVSYGCYLVFTNNYEDVLYRDCVEILPQSSFDTIYIYEQICSYEKYCTNIKSQKQGNYQEDIKKVSEYFKTVAINKGVKPGKIAALHSDGKIVAVHSKRGTDDPPMPEEAPGFYPDAQLKYEDFYIQVAQQSLYKQDEAILEPVQSVQLSQELVQVLEQKIQQDVVDADFDDLLVEELPIKKVKMKKVAPKKNEGWWGDTDASLATQNPDFRSEISAEYHSDENISNEEKKKDLYRKLYGGSIKAKHAEMISEISKEISEKQKIRSSAKSNTSQRFYKMDDNTWDTSATTTYSSVCVSPATTTLKIKMN